MLAWRVIGISLAIGKGQLGNVVDWVGITLSLHDKGVFATILQSRVEELRNLADNIAKRNVIGAKDLRMFVGKCQSFASLLWLWRPFVHMFYAALYGPSCGAPEGCVWT